MVISFLVLKKIVMNELLSGALAPHCRIHAPFQSALPLSCAGNARIRAPFQSALPHSHAIFCPHCRIHEPAMPAFACRFSPHCRIHAPFSVCIAPFMRWQCPHCRGLVCKGLRKVGPGPFLHSKKTENLNFSPKDYEYHVRSLEL